MDGQDRYANEKYGETVTEVPVRPDTDIKIEGGTKGDRLPKTGRNLRFDNEVTPYVTSDMSEIKVGVLKLCTDPDIMKDSLNNILENVDGFIVQRPLTSHSGDPYVIGVEEGLPLDVAIEGVGIYHFLDFVQKSIIFYEIYDIVRLPLQPISVSIESLPSSAMGMRWYDVEISILGITKDGHPYFTLKNITDRVFIIYS